MTARRRLTIQPNYLAHEGDAMSLVRGIRILRRILATEPFAVLRRVRAAARARMWRATTR